MSRDAVRWPRLSWLLLRSCVHGSDMESVDELSGHISKLLCRVVFRLPGERAFTKSHSRSGLLLAVVRDTPIPLSESADTLNVQQLCNNFSLDNPILAVVGLGLHSRGLANFNTVVHVRKWFA